ncbi:Insulin-like growth factor-binding protein 2-B [Liparis tanakae]|uniref:Insulin-like growth factor-binding protein 2-B n=1 Tax=Liparis tanakae TaxID=230148 RepID=A0A4Z2H5B6_9TELE|nr:Insulin-like growth factor-binding protein 2-B [Liparis tanakae]
MKAGLRAERLAACPRVTTPCPEIVREPGCGCCPLCARQEGELCGVYTPRCSGGRRCYPSTESELPLQQLIHGLGRCGQQVDSDVTTSLDQQATNDSLRFRWESCEVFEVAEALRGTAYADDEVHGTENPFAKRPAPDARVWQESARKQHLNERKAKMKTNQLDDARTQKVFQCNMSTHGQRGECWCVNPVTGVQIPATPKVRGDPNCDQFQEELRETPTEPASY